jgi:prepilin-type N-terminal cleavage/methylation domain-containing protein
VRLLSKDDGFTLLEMLAAMSILIVVFGATLALLEVFQQDTRVHQLRNETQDNVRSTIDALARQLRNGAAPSTLTPGALEKAGNYSIVFQTLEPSTTGVKGENAYNAVRVRYCLNNAVPSNEVLWKQTETWATSSAPPLPTAGTCPDLPDYETSSQVAQHIVNRIGGRKRPLFTYGPASWSSVSQITSVIPNIFIDLNPGEQPGESQLTSAIDLRNENQPPAASFTAVELGSGIVQLNASQSTDPDGLALAYKWWDNGEQLNATSQEAETKTLELGTTHTFKLEVAAPSGLASTATVALVIK